ncbi:MAG: hypothetical protein HOP28_14735 [Gemmatimonadales bacterium]|nr:hypothetical protein [Gemmatimonadales bacterium]
MTKRIVAENWKVTLLLAGIGAIAGALAAITLTVFGNILSGASQAPGRAVYWWNMGIFALLGGLFSPILAWSLLRRVPLWRAVAEPALAGVLGTVAAILIAPASFPVAVPAAILGAAWRLHHAYRDRSPANALPAP